MRHPVGERHLKDVEGNVIDCLLTRPEFLPETWQNRVMSTYSEEDEDVIPLEPNASSDIFHDVTSNDEESNKKVTAA